MMALGELDSCPVCMFVLGTTEIFFFLPVMQVIESHVAVQAPGQLWMVSIHTIGHRGDGSDVFVVWQSTGRR